MFEIKKLMFKGPNNRLSSLDFTNGVNVIVGASNTGKSFAFNSIDYMFGADKKLRNIKELADYDNVFLDIDIKDFGKYTLRRGIRSRKGIYSLYKGGSTENVDSLFNAIELRVKKDKHQKQTISDFYLNYLGIKDKIIVEKQNGQKRTLGLRDIMHLCAADETSIQAEISPIQTVRDPMSTAGKSAFRFFINGEDDSDVDGVEDGKTVKISKQAKIAILTEMLEDIAVKSIGFTSADDLELSLAKKNIELEDIKSKLKDYSSSISYLYENKKKFLEDESKFLRRQTTVCATIERFESLNNVYASDISRLLALEESSFLFSLQTLPPCQLCGASPEHQNEEITSHFFQQAKEASLAELAKIRKLQSELFVSLEELKREEQVNKNLLANVAKNITETNTAISRAEPILSNFEGKISAIVKERDEILTALSVAKQRKNLVAKIAETHAIREPTKKDYPPLHLSKRQITKFCKHISNVLYEWQFPWYKDVTFDEATYDIVIDGEHRVDNGKGVRAITHAAFKIALFLYCLEENHPHPGFVILDTPLLTYRDPIRSRYGALSQDESSLARTPLKQRFFEHLASLKNVGQFIIFENVELPENIDEFANVQIFFGNDDEGRYGLL